MLLQVRWCCLSLYRRLTAIRKDLQRLRPAEQIDRPCISCVQHQFRQGVSKPILC